MSNLTTLRFGWNYDLAFGIDGVFTSLEIIEILITMPVHVWVITTLLFQSKVISKDIRISYFSDQITMLTYGLMIGVLIKPYPIFPWPGYYCAGYLCEILDEHIISVLFSITFTMVIPFFTYILIRLHNQVVNGTPTKFIISSRNQVYIMTLIGIMLVVCVAGFGFLAVSAENSDFLTKAPELAALVSKGGRVIVIGLPGEAGIFQYEGVLLFITGVAFLPLLVALTAHSLIVIWSRDKQFHLSEKTQRAQDRLAMAFFLQMIAAAFFFVIPMLSFIYLMLVDTSYWSEELLSATRSTIIFALSLKPPCQSLIFLSKNPVLRKRALNQWRIWLCCGVANEHKKTPVHPITNKDSSQNSRRSTIS